LTCLKTPVGHLMVSLVGPEHGDERRGTPIFTKQTKLVNLNFPAFHLCGG
jgi:hypothetical protein